VFVFESLKIAENTVLNSRKYLKTMTRSSHMWKVTFWVSGKISQKYVFLGNSLQYHNAYKFSTKSHDHDVSPSNCAKDLESGWWYSTKGCYSANLNGKYFPNGRIESKGIVWYHWKKNKYSLKFVEMKIRAALW